jgi:hypothetical protein
MLFGAYSKYHPQHLPDSRFRFSTFRLSLPYGRRLLKNHIRLGTAEVHWTSHGHQKDIKRTPKWICFLAGHGVYAFVSQPFAS